MNPLWTLWSDGTVNESARAVADALLRASLEGGALALVVFLLTRLLRRRAPLVCVGLWRLVLARFALGLFGVGVAIGPAAPGAGAASSGRAVGAPDPVALAICGALLVGALFGAERLVRAAWRLWRLLRGAEEASPEWRRAWERACARRGVAFGAAPRLLASPHIDLPLAAAASPLSAAVVVVPAADGDGLGELSDADRERVLAHEWAHIRHGDPWAGWITAALEPVFFFHPLFWLARAEMHLAQEVAADRAALAAADAGAAGEYARLLLSLSRRSSTLDSPASAVAGALGLGHGFHALHRRLDALFAPPFRSWAVAAPRLAPAVGLALVLACLSLSQRQEAGMAVAAPTPISGVAVAVDVTESVGVSRVPVSPVSAAAVAAVGAPVSPAIARTRDVPERTARYAAPARAFTPGKNGRSAPVAAGTGGP